MRFRVLLGRTALGPEFLVDVSQQYHNIEAESAAFSTR